MTEPSRGKAWEQARNLRTLELQSPPAAATCRLASPAATSRGASPAATSRRAGLVSPSRGEASPDGELLSQSLPLDAATTSDSGGRAGDKKVSSSLRELQFKFEKKFSCNLNTIAGLKWTVLATHQKLNQLYLQQKEWFESHSAPGVPAPAREGDAVQGRVQLPLKTREEYLTLGESMADSKFKSDLVSLILYATFMDYCQSNCREICFVAYKRSFTQ